MNGRSDLLDRAWRGFLLGLMTLFVVNIGLMIVSVATSSFARRWLGTWLPDGWTTNWYTAAWKEFQLFDVLWVTVEVVFAVVFLALLIGVPAAYTLARRNFAGKRALMLFGVISSPLRLVHNYTGVMLSLILSGFPFTFLLTLSYITGIDPSLEQAAATLGARPRSRFRHILLPLLAQGLAINFCLSFVQTFSVFPSAVLLGAPAGATRVISIAAYQAAYEQYDYSMASAIAMIMGFVQLLVVTLVLAARGLVYRGAAGAGKG